AHCRSELARDNGVLARTSLFNRATTAIAKLHFPTRNVRQSLTNDIGTVFPPVFAANAILIMNQRSSQLTTLRAIDAFTGGIGFVVTTPRIWGYAIVPAVMLAVLSVAFIALGIWGAAELSAHLFDPVANTWMGIGKWIVTIMLGIIGILVAILLALLLA